MAEELGRYESAVDWKPKDPYKKLRERLRKEEAMQPNSADSMLEMRPAGKWITDGRRTKTRSFDLFGTLWRDSEVGVLFGEKGSGKSILAVQLAESIATGGNTTGRECAPSSIRDSRSTIRSQKVLYIDFQRTKQQFAERYSAPSPFPGKPPIPQSFKFQRAQIEWDGHIPAAFKNDVTAYLQHSIFHKIDESKAKIVIIDDISHLAKNISSNTNCLRVMKTLKLWAATYGLSILVIAHQRLSSPPARGGVAEALRRRGGGSPHSSGRPISLADIAGSSYIAQLADSVFCIGRSTFNPDFRYVKHLASPAQIIHDASNVLTYQIGRNTTGRECAPQTTGCADRNLLALTTTNPHSAIRNPQYEIPFLGLTYLGVSTESDHLRDYEKEARMREKDDREAERAHQAQLRKLRTRTSRSALVDGILDGTYTRYLKGS